MPRVALVSAPAIVDRLRIVAVADACAAADRACVNFHHVPLVAAARPRDLLLRAKHLFVEAIAWRPSSLGEDRRFDVVVSFDDRRGYVGSALELQSPVIALKPRWGRKVEALMSPDEVIVMLSLDRGARLERDRRRLTGRPRPGYRPSA